MNLASNPNTAETVPVPEYPTGRIRFSWITTIIGVIVFVIGAKPEWFNLDRSPVIGFVQIAVFLVGLALICLGGYVGLVALWRDSQRSIAADIGLRLVATGYVVAVFAGMADIFGMGSDPLPGIPFFGLWQARGVEIGELIIAIGFLMLIPFQRAQKI